MFIANPERASLSPLARLRQLRAIGALLIVLALAPFWACISAARPRRALERAAWCILLSGFGIAVRRHGTPASSGRVLTVANHISWVDIAVLARLCEGGFIAKREVAGWPVIGALARRLGCVFIDRESRSAVQSAVAELSDYAPETGLIMFPEGTTGEGGALLPFRSSLFAAAGPRWTQIQPVTLAYRRRDGAPLCPVGRRRIAWLGDDALLPHAMALAASGGARIDVWFEAPLSPAPRKELARACADAIGARLAALEQADQAATLKRAA
ncbi:lysophospholipid acyltransferase family protein [Novosphingobium sp.]|uniref:lysophospholipid acyltransferase family protein n=1 Tax=Novosphingobium sp. TaxID=1874826 RepID=UPI0035B0D6D4